MCGEYGEKTQRPHYHACIFGLDFEDKQLWSIRNGTRLYTSATLARIWGKGHVVIGSVTFESAAYIARYVMKKITGAPAKEHYVHVDKTSGLYSQISPEYTSMSLKDGGIGGNWYELYKKDVYPSDNVIVGGKVYKVPKYFDKKYEIENPEGIVKVKIKRKESALLRKAENTRERLIVREQCKKAQISRLLRNLQEEI